MTGANLSNFFLFYFVTVIFQIQSRPTTRQNSLTICQNLDFPLHYQVYFQHCVSNKCISKHRVDGKINSQIPVNQSSQSLPSFHVLTQTAMSVREKTESNLNSRDLTVTGYARTKLIAPSKNY